jgi:ubiquinone/menaquinone biosynthesis C-methylase UbiE
VLRPQTSSSSSSQEPREYPWKKLTITELDKPEIESLWVDFVNCPKRQKTLQPFLSDTLKKQNCTYILDAAAGIGCESIWLAEKGEYAITCNESSRPLLDKAIDTARRRGVDTRITWSRCNWTMLSFEFKWEEFDAILLLGSALSRFLDDQDRKRSLDQFYKILKPGGILIIDERNFTKISKHKDIMMDKPNVFYDKFYSGNYVYCGEEVRGWPHKIDGKIVTFRYARNESPQINAEIPLYMFKTDEMKGILERAEFKDIEEYSDFKPGISVDADFFTYVAHKPKRHT